MRAIIADDHALVREGLVAFLRMAEPDWDVRQAGSLEELTELLLEDTDLVIADLNMPGVHGSGSFASFREANPHVKLAVLTATEDRTMILECLSAGVHGYILKADATTELLTAIKTIVSGGIYVPARLSQLVSKQSAIVQRDTVEPGLTKRQREVMELLAKGMSTKSIARQMALGVGTVKVHLAALYRTLDVHSRMEAIVKVQSMTSPD